LALKKEAIFVASLSACLKYDGFGSQNTRKGPVSVFVNNTSYDFTVFFRDLGGPVFK